MIVWLDHKIFGNGYGMASPYFDGKFYWLSGQFYTFMHGFGAQLHSYQWRHPKAGEERKLSGRCYRPFHSHRRWLYLWRDKYWAVRLPIARVEVAWCTHLPENIDAANAEIREIEKKLGGIL